MLMAVVASVLFDGSSNGNGSVVELEGGEYVWLNSGDLYEEGEEYDESYSTIEQRDLSDVSLENIVFSSWGDNGPKFYFWDGRALRSQEFLDRNGQLETDGSLKTVDEDSLYELESSYREDLNGDDEIGKPPVVIRQVLFDGSSNGNGSVVELEGGEFAWLSNGGSYEEGDEYDEYYSAIKQRDLSDVSLENIVLSYWGDSGPKFYFWNGESLYSQKFRDRNGQLETDGSLKTVDEDSLYELESSYREDLNGDDEIGKPPVVIRQVLFDGSRNGNGSVVELEGGEYVWFNSGDLYEEGDEYAWHTDGHQDQYAARHLVEKSIDPMPLNKTTNPLLAGLVRKVSLTVNLSFPEDYEGGTLELHFHNQTHVFDQCPRGSAIAFPSFIHHRVAPVTNGIRKTAVMWLNGPPLR